jgi:hypothetical protein
MAGREIMRTDSILPWNGGMVRRDYASGQILGRSSPLHLSRASAIDVSSVARRLRPRVHDEAERRVSRVPNSHIFGVAVVIALPGYSLGRRIIRQIAGRQ